MAWLETLFAQLTQNAWSVVVLALLASLTIRVLRCGPVTRHALWLAVLAWFAAPALLPAPPSARWLQQAESRIAVTAAEAAAASTASTKSLVAQAPQRDESHEAAPPRVRSALAAKRGSTVRSESPRVATDAQTQPSPLRSSAAAPTRREDTLVKRPAPAAVQPAAPRDAPPETARVERLVEPITSAESHTARAESAAPPPATRTVERDPVPTLARRPAVSGLSASPSGTAIVSEIGDAESRGGALSVRPRGASPMSDGPAAPAADRSAAQRWWDGLVAATFAVRGALSSVPRMPLEVWLAGAALVLAWNLLGIGLFLLRVRRSERAPEWVQREVRGVASRLKLPRIPEVRLVDARVSPLVWCGWRVQLLLPRTLWRELDRHGRCAILCHELAHLRRRDHWVLRLDLLAAVLLWWHPVAWWARARIQEEADNCCDAWVTWLMPRSRRAYAEALLKTRMFTAETIGQRPSLGAAVATSGARRLARRVTMVMTHSNRPRQSWSGMALLGTVLVAGWLAHPALSLAQSAPPTPQAEPAPTPEPATALFAYPGQQATPPAQPAPPARRGRAAPPAPAAEPAPPAPPFPGAMRTVPPSGARGAFGGGMAAGGPVAMMTSPDTREYKVSAGKLEALQELLKRDDVPLRIQLRDDVLVVMAPPAEQEIVAAFLREIDPPAAGEKQWREYPMPEGKLEALYALMAREDVPIYVSRDDGRLRAEVTDAQHEVLSGFLRLLGEAGGTGPSGRFERAPGQARGTAPRAEARSAPQRRERFDAKREEMRRMQEAAQMQQRAAREHADGFRRHAEELRAQSERMRPRLDGLQQEIERARGAAAEASHDSVRRELERAVRELERATRELEKHLQRLENEAERVQNEAETSEQWTAEVKSQLEAAHATLEAELEALEEAEEMIEEENSGGASDAETDDRAATANLLAPLVGLSAYADPTPVAVRTNIAGVQPLRSLTALSYLQPLRASAVSLPSLATLLSSDHRDEMRARLREALLEAHRDAGVELDDAAMDALCEHACKQIHAALERGDAAAILRTTPVGAVNLSAPATADHPCESHDAAPTAPH